jgi:hypothetical protein
MRESANLKLGRGCSHYAKPHTVLQQGNPAEKPGSNYKTQRNRPTAASSSSVHMVNFLANVSGAKLVESKAPTALKGVLTIFCLF